ncbi:MAG: hypothetical protein RL625_202 [Gemmatimonadota bacterium]
MTPPTPSGNGLMRQDVTKIVATLGPSSTESGVIRQLLHAGVNVVRINFSHGTHEKHAQVIQTVRAIADELRLPVAILGDLQGPRIRIGVLPEPMELQVGQQLTLVHEAQVEQGAGEIPVTYDHIADDVRPGANILINDGLLDLQVDRVEGARVHCTVRIGGRLSSNKGINLPGIEVSAPSLTEKDRTDITFAIAQDLDYLALSFVRRPEDIAALRALLPKGMLIVAKIEKDSALERIEEILQASDAVMVARGDLGVELPFESVPLQQKRIIALAARYGRPVITATQMLESMVEHPRPTRAEASDVANAILDGTDAVMLSAETAAGRYPVLAVEAMRRIAVAAEGARVARGQGLDRVTPGSATTEETIAAAAVTAVRMMGAHSLVVFTKSGFSARMMAARRPDVRIVVLTDQPRTYRQLALVWGVVPFLVAPAETYQDMLTIARGLLLRHGFAEAGERILVTAGVPFNIPGTTNLLKVETV